MALLATVVSGQLAVPAQYNSLVSAFSNVFGILDDSQTNVGKIPIPYVTSNPLTPVNGSIWWRSDETRLYVRSGGANIPLRSPRQLVEATQLQNVGYGVTTNFADITSLSVNITTSGGRLLIGMASGSFTDDDVTTTLIQGLDTGSAQSVGIEILIRAVVGATNLIPISFRQSVNPASSIVMRATPPGFAWLNTPAAGTYTVKLQARYIATVNGSATIQNTKIVVLEI